MVRKLVMFRASFVLVCRYFLFPFLDRLIWLLNLQVDDMCVHSVSELTSFLLCTTATKDGVDIWPGVVSTFQPFFLCRKLFRDGFHPELLLCSVVYLSLSVELTACLDAGWIVSSIYVTGEWTHFLSLKII